MHHKKKWHFAKLCREKKKNPSTGFLHLIITKLNLSFTRAQDVKTSGRPNP